MNPLAPTLLVTCATLWAAALPGRAETPSAGITADRILSEEERQLHVNRRLDRVIGGFQALVEDLESNNLLEQGRAGELLDRMALLAALNDEQVAAAAQSLRQARQSLEDPRPHLETAEGHVARILAELRQLIDLAEQIQSERELLRALREIIEEQETVAGESREIGRRFLQDQAKWREPLGNLAGSQKTLADRTRAFQEQLRQTEAQRPDDRPAAGFRDAMKQMTSEQPDQRMEHSARQILGENFVSAVQNQAAALATLRKVERLLDQESGESPPALVAEQIQDRLRALGEGQRQLREDVQAATPAQFAERADELQLKQHDLAGQLQQEAQALAQAVVRSADSPAQAGLREAAQALQQAGQAMEQAEQAMTQQQQADTHASQQQAEAALANAIGALDKSAAAMAAADPAARADALAQLRERQQDLRAQAAAQAGANQPVSALATPQQQLGARLDRLAAAIEPSMAAPEGGTSPLGQALRDAQQAMDQAGKALAGNQADPAMDAQRQAEKALAEAQAQAEAMAAQAAEQAAGGEGEQAKQDGHGQGEKKEETGKGNHKGEGQGEHKGEGKGKGEHKGKGEGQGEHKGEGQGEHKGEGQGDHKGKGKGEGQGEHKGKGEGQGKGEGKGEGEGQGKGKGEGKGEGQSMSLAKGAGGKGGVVAGPLPIVSPGASPGEGKRTFIKTGTGGLRLMRGDSDWEPLSPREREVLDASFARELPIEYRELLKDYYRTLAVEAEP